MATKLILVTSEVKYLRISPRKLRLIANAIKELEPVEVLARLNVWNNKASRLLTKAIKAVLADAENNFGLEKNTLEFVEILANEGPRLKRIDHFHGARFQQGLRRKRMSHLKITVKGEKKK